MTRHAENKVAAQSPCVWSLVIFVLCCLTGCAQTGVRLVGRTLETQLSPPGRILVYDFAVDPADVKEYQGIMRQQPSVKDSVERQRIIARAVSNTLTTDLVEGIRALGLTVERVGRGTPANDNDVAIDGHFLNVDEGSPFRRLVLGFGSGASRVETRIELYQGAELRKLLEFTTHSESGKMPGAAVTVPIGAAVPVGASIALTAGNAASIGFKPNSNEVAPMAGSSADQAVRYLSEFFAKQGWITPDRVKKARLVY